MTELITWRDVYALAPEIFLALASMVLLITAVFRRDERHRSIYLAAAIILMITLIILYVIPAERLDVFYGAFVQDSFTRVMKTLILFGGIILLFITRGFLRVEVIDRFEFPILVLLATLGMMIIISAHDFITMFIGFELQSLALYVLAAFDRRSVRSGESGIKYFLLGALASGILIYGCSLVYGFSGTLDFDLLAQKPLNAGTQLGLIFILAGIGFKIAAVPFHMWLPDVYEGAPTPSAMFFASTTKIAAFAVLARIVIEALPEGDNFIVPAIIFLSVGSMAVGALAAIAQSSIRRLIAYSSISHAGYVLIGIAAGTPAGVQGVIIYLAIYMVSVIGLFCCLLALRRNEASLDRILDLSGLSKTHPTIAFCMAALLLSMAGIPPLAGFFAKFYIFLAAIDAGFYLLAIFGIITSAIAAYYYLNIVKLMYFDDPDEELDMELPASARIFLGLSAILILAFVLAPRWLILPASLVAEGMSG